MARNQRQSWNAPVCLRVEVGSGFGLQFFHFITITNYSPLPEDWCDYPSQLAHRVNRFLSFFDTAQQLRDHGPVISLAQAHWVY